LLFQNRRARIIAALLFLAHPLPGFSVNYLSARSGMLSCLFMLSSLVCWLKWDGREPGQKLPWLIASLGFFILALLSKTDALSFIFVLGCLLLFSARDNEENLLGLWLKWFPHKIPPPLRGGEQGEGELKKPHQSPSPLKGEGENSSRFWQQPFLSWWHFVVLGVCFSVVYKLVSGSLLGAVRENMIPVHSRGASILAGISAPWIYFFKLLFPSHLTLFPALPEPRWLLLLLSLAGYVMTIVLVARYRTLKLWLPLVWYFGAILPLTLLRLNILLAWHRGYISLSGLFIGAGLLADFALRKRRASGMALLGLVLVLLGAVSNFQARAWQDPVRLWTEAVAYAPGEFVPHHFLGTLLINRGAPAQAERELLTALQLNPEFVDARNSLGALYFQERELFQARDQFEECVRLDPENYIYLENLLIVRQKLLQIGGMDRMVERLLQIAPADDPKLLQIIDRYEELRAAAEGKNFAPEK